MVTQVDWWQIKNAPPLGQTVLDDYPISTGPYTVPILLINNEGGLRVDDFQAVNTIRASLTQQGVIGTLGDQQIYGPIWFVPVGAVSPVPIIPALDYGVVLQDGGLGFYLSSEGSLLALNASIDYSVTGFGPTLSLNSTSWIVLTCGNSGDSDIRLTNPASGAIWDMDAIAGTSLFDPVGIVLSGGDNAAVQIFGNTIGADPNLDLGGAVGMPYFSLNSQAVTGKYGSDLLGNVFSGGICTTVGSGATIPWGSITGTPTTFVGYGLPTPILPGDAAGGDLNGTYPNPGVAAIQGFPLAISGPISGDVLTWGGLSWVAAPGGGGGGLAIGNPVGGGAGNRVLLEDPAANLADSPQVLWDATNGMYVNDGATCSSRLAQFGVAASFDDGINNARMCDGTWAMQVTSGAIKLAGGTVDFPNSHIPPTTTQAVPAPASAYGQGVISNYLGDPDVWVQVTLGGVQYVLPLYLP